MDCAQDYAHSCQDWFPRVIAIINSGSTHNFISERLANEMRLLVVRDAITSDANHNFHGAGSEWREIEVSRAF
jgi:hypothetical protein